MPTARANPFIDVVPGSSTVLPSSDRFGRSGHRWDGREIDALIAAFAAQRPLLVRGEAGSGKSQLARAAAVVLGGEDASPLCEVIHPRFEALDLLYRFDAVARLADAQAQDLARVADLGNYMRHGVLWHAMARSRPEAPRPVVLIDEIDKADADVPNALLDVLGNRALTNTLTGESIPADGRPMPLLIITTNEERELPPAFVRRCLVLNLNPPKGREPFIEWLTVRAQAHDDLAVDSEVTAKAADKVWTDRSAAARLGQQTVGLAEFIDLLSALTDITRQERTAAKRKKAQLAWLDRLSTYFLVKGADMPQSAGGRPV